MQSVKDFDVQNKRILVRCDFNVPVDEEGTILDDFRMLKALPTIQYLINNDAKVILLAHLGEPEGIHVPHLTLDKVKNKLEELLGFSVKKMDDCVGQEVQQAIEELLPGKVLLLENVRFHKEETENNPEFAQQLASLSDIYINDAFDVCHREHASVVGIPQYISHGAGLQLQKEVENLTKILDNPKKPFVVIMGGAKVETKAKFISHIATVADMILIGGLLKKELGRTPENVFGPSGDFSGFDINEETIADFSKKIAGAKTILWNGPLGKCEEEEYQKGTLAIAHAIIASGAFSIIGGGDTIAFLDKESILDKFSHVSTGGGALLEFLSGQELPGLEVLKK